MADQNLQQKVYQTSFMDWFPRSPNMGFAADSSQQYHLRGNKVSQFSTSFVMGHSIIFFVGSYIVVRLEVSLEESIGQLGK